MPTQPRMSAAKAWIAGLGTTLTAVTTVLATLQVALSDDAFSTDEVATIVIALLTAGSTIYGVWRIPNKIQPEEWQ